MPDPAESTEEADDLEGLEDLPESLPSTPGKLYLVKSAARGRHNRVERRTMGGRRGLIQKLAGGTLLIRRGSPRLLSEALVLTHLAELKRAVAEHRILVTTPAGQAVDLETFNVVGAPLPTQTLPHPPLDSAQNDKNENIGYDVPPTPEGTTAGAPVPELLQDELHVAESLADAPSVPPPAMIPPAMPVKRVKQKGKRG